ncbi:xyloglucanase [Abditibacteriota bacterium]|nr:xyloglucanase [Abditibacteriota bacterium]
MDVTRADGDTRGDSNHNYSMNSFFLSLTLFTAFGATLLDRPAVAAPATYGAWHSCFIGGGGYQQNVLFTSNPNVVYDYMDVGGAFRSDDGGKSWRMLGAGLKGAGSGVTNVRDLSVNPRDPDDVLVAVGDTWAPIEGVFRSRDGGKSWQKMVAAQFYGNQDFRWAGRNLARSPLDPDRVLVVSGGDGAFLSSDGGTTWKPCGLEGIYPTDVKWGRDGKTVWVCAQTEKIGYRGQQTDLRGGLFRSDDGGTTWKTISDKAPSEVLQDPQTLARWWGIWDGHSIQTSSDGGTTWLAASDGLPQIEADENISTGTSEKAFGALGVGPNFLLTASNRGTFYRLDLPSSTWKKLETPQVREIYEGQPWGSRMQPGTWPHFGAALSSISVDPHNPQRWFFTDWFAIYRSEDAGKSWDLSIDGIEATVIHTLRSAPDDPARIHLGMADNGYFFSTDGGTRFEKTQIMSNTKSIATNRTQPELLMVAGDAGDGQWVARQVWLSADAGQSWAKSPMSGLPLDMHANSITTLPDDAQKVLLAVAGEVKSGGGGVYASMDGGQSWKWDAAGMEGGEFFADSIFGTGQEVGALASGELMAIGQKRGALYWRAAGNPKWAKVAVDIKGQPYEIAAGTHEFWVAVHNDGVYRVEKGVAVKVWNGDAGRVAVDGARVAIGEKEGVELSLDAGRTWTLDSDLPNRFWPIVAFAGDRLLAGTAGNGAFWKPLVPTALATPSAHPVAPRAVQFDMKPKSPLPEAPSLVWAPTGKLEVNTQNGVTTLKSQNGFAQGSMGVNMTQFNPQTFLGAARVEGDIEEALVALQGFDATGKQVSWQTLLDAKSAREWQNFAVRSSWPAGAARVMWVITFKGTGSVSVRGLGTSDF